MGDSKRTKEEDNKAKRPVSRTKKKKQINAALAQPEEISSSEIARESISPTAAHTTLSKEDESKKKSSLLQRLKIKKEKGGKQDQRRAATKIQAVWRGYNFRRKFGTTGPPSVSLKQLNALQEIIKIETKYV